MLTYLFKKKIYIVRRILYVWWTGVEEFCMYDEPV